MTVTYTELLGSPDWYQSFDNTNVPQLSYPGTTFTTSTADVVSSLGLIDRTYTVDAVPNTGTTNCLLLSAGARYKGELPSFPSTYPKPTGAKYYDGFTFEFWIKVPSDYTHTVNVELLDFDYASSASTKVMLTPQAEIFLDSESDASGFNGAFDYGDITSGALIKGAWNLVTIVCKWDYQVQPTSSSVSWVSQRIIYVNGFYNLNSIKGNAGGITTTNLLSPTAAVSTDTFLQGPYPYGNNYFGVPTYRLGSFSSQNFSAYPIQIAHFAYWQNKACSQKEILRRYAHGSGNAKATQTQLRELSNPWWWIDFNNSTKNFDEQGNPTGWDIGNQGGPALALNNNNPIGSYFPNNNDYQHKDNIEGRSFYANGTPATWTDTFSGAITFDPAFISNIQTKVQSGNFSIEAWVKWEWLHNPNYQKLALSFVFSIFGTNFIEQNLRINTALLPGMVRRYNNVNYVTDVVSFPETQRLITNGDWVHIAKTTSYNGTVLTERLYINGNLLINQNITTSTLSNSQAFSEYSIFRSGLANAMEKKAIDFFAFYDRPMTESEVKYRYAAYVMPPKDIRTYTEGEWKPSTMNKYYNGTNWVDFDTNVQRYDGTNWVQV